MRRPRRSLGIGLLGAVLLTAGAFGSLVVGDSYAAPVFMRSATSGPVGVLAPTHPPIPPECTGEAWAGATIVVLTAGPDEYNGGNGKQIIFGLGGDDEIRGGNGKDCIIGGEGKDEIKGGNGKDVLLGGPGDDEIEGGNGPDYIDGGPGEDQCAGNNGPEIVNCEDHDDDGDDDDGDDGGDDGDDDHHGKGDKKSVDTPPTGLTKDNATDGEPANDADPGDGTPTPEPTPGGSVPEGERGAIGGLVGSGPGYATPLAPTPTPAATKTPTPTPTPRPASSSGGGGSSVLKTVVPTRGPLH